MSGTSTSRKPVKHLAVPGPAQAVHPPQLLPDKHAFPSKRGKNIPAQQPGAHVEMIQERDHGQAGAKRSTKR